ncbi:MAG: PSD1 and planctomycete cytochrome C domain-containing protein [Planctomycetaceae bacterium]
MFRVVFKTRWKRFFIFAGALLAVGAPSLGSAETPESHAAPSAAQIEFFEERVRPLLAEQCWPCHGSKKQESGLRLDSREAILKGGDSGRVAKAGNPDESPLIEAVNWSGRLQMPPDEMLLEDDIAILAGWIKQGLPWPADTSSTQPSAPDAASHWAFQPLQPVPIPAVDASVAERAVMPVDAFLLEKLSAHDLTFSSPADRRTLIRRATFDLWGLPPAPEAVAEFESDDSPDAYARLIDRLLASPRYGERWGRYWLDVARYADNKGYVFFEEKNLPWAYTYRDYVIRAFNDDLPYDRFLIEQLAADQLDLGDDQLPLTALGFLTVGSRFLNNLYDMLDDRIDVVSRGVMGLTVSCARCHDHKFDPITQADYYALYGVFRSSSEPLVPPVFQPIAETDQTREFQTELDNRLQKLSGFIDTTHAELVSGARSRLAEYLMAAYQLRNQPITEDFMLLVDKGELNPSIIVRWQLYLEKTAREADPVWRLWHRFAELPAEEFETRASALIDELSNADDSAQRGNRRLWESFVKLPPPKTMNEVADRYVLNLSEIEDLWQQEIEQATVENQPTPERFADDDDEALRQVLVGSASPLNIPRQLGWGFLSLLPDRPSQEEFKKLLGEVEKHSASGAGAPPRAMVLQDDATPYEPRVFLRGNPSRLGPEVPRRFLSLFDPEETPFSQGSGRYELAMKLVSDDNVLTPRVMVNRVWLHHVGKGLVTTPGDFGLRSDPPSHPELLNYLAYKFRSEGWSIKSLHREIMLSAAYQQSNAMNETAARLDPENRWLWRMNRRRLDWEAFRDAHLSVSGAMENRIGGASVDIAVPPFVERRTVYGYIDRLDLPGLFTTFDFPSPASTNPSRDETTIAPQALFQMNHPFATETANRLLQRQDVATLTSTTEKIDRIYAVIFQRTPMEEERQLAEEYLGESADSDRWLRFVHALLMTNEFVFVD